MIRRILLCLVVAGTFVFIFFQVYTMYDMMFHTREVSIEGEDGIVIRQGKADDPRIAFTCNVDWGEAVIPDMLEILEENDLKITFFISGKWAKNNPWLLRKIFVHGHEIQNHGYGHRLCSRISEQEVREEIGKTEDVIQYYTGVETNIFAPPSGDYDAKTVGICKDMDYLLSLWSVDTIDWREGSTAKVILDRVLKKDLAGAILLMHPKEETVKALPKIIEKIEERGLSIVSLSELMNEDFNTN
ncbi:MAG: polysaccharide deacetylase family protein [Clostridiales bacterium]|nr:polysaccharide deacetylase family protein [Clostridiales bacterium]